MNELEKSCRVTEPSGSYLAALFGVAVVFFSLAAVDYFFVDVVPEFLTLSWTRSVLGVMSNNEAAICDASWVYMSIVLPSFVVGMIAVKWYKAIVSAALVPLASGAAYALLGMSFGEGMQLSAFLVNPIVISPFYIIPSVLASIIVMSILSKKTAVEPKNIVTNIK